MYMQARIFASFEFTGNQLQTNDEQPVSWLRLGASYDSGFTTIMSNLHIAARLTGGP